MSSTQRRSILKPAVIEQSAAKIGIFGPGGSGKSLTATLIAIALSKLYHKGAPVIMQDTEGASDWLIPIYKAEGVELHRVKSKSFVDMRQALREGEEMGACVFIDDSYSHPWQELQSSLKKRLNVRKLEFHHMQELQELWQEWVEQFLNSQLHCVLAGRLAYEWENDVDVETGRMGFHKAGTKMRSEKDAGYEPHLLIEMEAIRVMQEVREVAQGHGRKKKTKIDKKAGGHFQHRLHILKDRSRILNGRMFEFHDINDYKPGGWNLVFEALKPHFDNMNIGGSENHAISSNRTSAELFDDRGMSAYQQRSKQVAIALEEIEGTLVTLWSGQDAKSKELKRTAVESLFNTRSWTAVENESLETMEWALGVLRQFEKRFSKEAPSAITDKDAAIAFLDKLKAEPRGETYEQITPKPLQEAHKGLDKLQLEQLWSNSEFAAVSSKKGSSIAKTGLDLGWTPAQFLKLIESFDVPVDTLKCDQETYDRILISIARGPEEVIPKLPVRITEPETVQA